MPVRCSRGSAPPALHPLLGPADVAQGVDPSRDLGRGGVLGDGALGLGELAGRGDVVGVAEGGGQCLERLVVRVPFPVVGVVVGEPPGEPAPGAEEQQQCTCDEAEHDVRDAERQQVQRRAQHQRVHQAGRHEGRADDDQHGGGGAAPAQARGDEDRRDDHRDRRQQPVAGQPEHRPAGGREHVEPVDETEHPEGAEAEAEHDGPGPVQVVELAR